MDKIKEIETFGRLQRLTSFFQHIGQLSWTANQTKKRYPTPERLTNEEVETLIKIYLTFGYDIEEIYKEWQKEIKDYKNES